MPLNARDKPRTSRDKHGQAGTKRDKAGTKRNKQGQALSDPVCLYLSLLVPVCPYLSLLVICPYVSLSLSVPGFPCLSRCVPLPLPFTWLSLSTHVCPCLPLSNHVCPCLSKLSPLVPLTALHQGLSKYLTAQDTQVMPTLTKHSRTLARMSIIASLHQESTIQ